jgi:hypothetical protein
MTRARFHGRDFRRRGASLKDGSFGMAEETGIFINQAISDGSKQGLDIDAALGEAIVKARLAHHRLSLLAPAAGLGIPVECIYKHHRFCYGNS